MGARTIPDQSGGQLRWLVSKAGQRTHRFNVHVAPWTAVTGAYVGSYTNGDSTVFDTAHHLFDVLKLCWDTSTTLSWQGAFPVASGAVQALSNVDPAAAPSAVSGSCTGGSANTLGAQWTETFHDNFGNTMKLVFLDARAALTDFEGRRVITPVAGPTDPVITLANILTGFVAGGPNFTTPYMSHAGGTIQTPITLASTFNHRLRRDYGEI